MSNVLDDSTIYIKNFESNDSMILKAGSSTASNTNTSDGVISVSLNNGAEGYYIYTDAEDEQLVLNNLTLASVWYRLILFAKLNDKVCFIGNQFSS